MSNLQRVEHSDVPEIQAEIEHGYALLQKTNARRRILESQLAQLGANAPAGLQFDLDETRTKIEKLETQLEQLEAIAQKMDEQPQPDGTFLPAEREVFTPRWSVKPAHVQYVDANLAFRFADASQDLQVVLGFTTLFLGAAISFAISIFTAKSPSELILFCTATGFSLVFSVILGILTVRANNQLRRVKEQLFSSKDTE
jgi:hypothetical protein